MQVTLTGNPFVDTGLAVLASLAKKDTINDLTTDDIKRVHGDGKILASCNSRLKSTSMIFTINSIITNPAIKNYEKRLLYYSKIITAILENFDTHDIDERCESCGNQYSLDIDNLIRKTLGPLGYDDGKRYVGRDWFPLAGSLRSDAQALPSCSRAPNLCAKCLFAVHYLPLGVILVDGRITLFQSTNIEFWYELISEISSDMYNRISAQNYSTIGSKEGSTSAIKRLLSVMSRMNNDVVKGTSLFIWKFSNSGTGPDCKFEEIPNKALEFLQYAVRYGLRNEILELIMKDKSPEFSFLKCISFGRNYLSLYPYKKFNGVSQKFFFLYQTIILNVLIKKINTAYKISKQLELSLSPTEFDKFGRDLENNFASKNFIKKMIVKMVSDNLISFDEYYDLFTDVSKNTQTGYDSWKLIKYYMHHTKEELFFEQLQSNEKVNNRSDDLWKKSLINLGTAIYKNYIQEKGREKFIKTVLNNFITQINPKWLKNQFVKLAEIREEFTYEYWKYLCLDSNGKESIYTVLYNLRLLWTEWIQKGVNSNTSDLSINISDTTTKLNSDILPTYKESIEQLGLYYLQKFGDVRYQRDILKEFRNKSKGFFWLRQKLVSFNSQFNNDEFWDLFLCDMSGNDIRHIRLFQIQIILANLYRNHTLNALT